VTPYLIIFAVAVVVAVTATPLAARLARLAGIVDQPTARKIHVTPTPLLGGVAIFASALVAAAVVVWLTVALGVRFAATALFNWPELIGDQAMALLAGATLMAAVGIVDDRRPLPWVAKLLAQVAAACILWRFEIQIRSLTWDPYNLTNFAATVLWVVTVTNAINFLDNMDGLSAGIVAVMASFFFLLAALSGQVIVAGVSIALAGACVGFLRYNFNRASIFMGDAGTLFLGFCLAALGIKLRFDNAAFVTWMIPILVLGLPLFDITLVVVSRLRHGLSPTTAGKDHVSHRLVALGLTRREAVLTLYLVCCVLGMAALVVMYAPVSDGYIVGGLVLAVALYAYYRLERVSDRVYPARRAGETMTAFDSSSRP